MNENNNKLVYIYDTLCGWCYVASPVMKAIADFAKENGIEFEFHHRQLFTDNYVPVMSEDFVKMIKRVGSETAPKMTGIRFSDKYYELVVSEGFEHNSYLTSLGIAAAKQLARKNEIAFTYGKQLQDLVFKEGQDPNKLGTIINAAQGIFEVDEFRAVLESDHTKKLADEEADIAINISNKLSEEGIPFLYYFNESEGKYIKLDPFRLDKTKEYLEKLTKGSV